jgi:hypothetical protein
MKQPLKYNWFALFFLTILVIAVFFTAMTGWHFGSMNGAAASDAATADRAMAPFSVASTIRPAGDAPKAAAAILAARSGMKELKAVDKDGLPLPDDYTGCFIEKGPHFHSITASSPSSLTSLTAFYRRELSSRKWSEMPAAAGGATNAPAQWFVDGKGDRLDLKLIPNGNMGTDLTVSVQSTEGITEADSPPPGGVRKVYMSEMTDHQAVSH